MTLEKTVLEFCRSEKLLPKNGRVLAAVSGGADSMCMLHVLLKLSETEGFSLTAATLDHRLRGEESAADAEFVRRHCETLGIPCIVGEADVPELMRCTKTGAEEAARNARYGFLRSAAQSCGADVIATAHTADDNGETMLMNLARGTGLRGLCGIPPKRDGLIRPMLCVTRREVEDFLAAGGIAHREDSSNKDDAYTRNRLRHHVMPALKGVFPQAVRSFFDAAMLLREDEAYLISQAQTFLNAHYTHGRLPSKALLELPYAVSSRAVRLCCPKALEKHHVDAVLSLCEKKDPSARIDLPGICVRREYGTLVFGGTPEADTLPEISLDTDEGEAVLPEANLRLRWRTVTENPGIYKSFTAFCFKTADICGKITVRSRREGDRLTLLDTGCEKTVKKLMIERKLPAHKRGLIPIMADESGPLGVYGLARAGRALPEDGCPILEIIFEEITTYDHAE